MTGPTPSQPEASGDLEEMLSFALQRSERLRLWIVSGVISLMGVMTIARHLAGRTLMQGAAFTATLTLIAVALLIAAAGAHLVGRAQRQRRLMPPWFWTATVMADTTFPSAALLVLLRFTDLQPLEAVSAPAVIGYAIFACAGVLRLRPGLCLLGAVLTALQHGTLTAMALRAAGDARHAAQLAIAFTTAATVSWLVAAVVAREVRRHVIAGLREARTRAELAGLRDKLDLAREIQAGLLPAAPLRLERFEVMGFNRPADETGGDYFDWILLPDGRAAVLIADVTGHGIGPAILMAVCRAYARATVPSDAPVTATLARLNSLIAADFAAGRFVTLALALLDPRSGEVELLSAGHGPTLWHRAASGEVRAFSGDGPPLGVVPDIDFDNPARLRMEPGDSLLLTTDGFIETARPDGRLYQPEGLTASFRRHAARPTADLLDRIDQDRLEFAAGEPQRDDVTAVLIRCNAQPR